MKEQLYTIPVNDAFATDCECPVCAMRQTLEQNAVAYTMGPSYMEDDIRMETDRVGFCKRHMQMLWDQNNKLGLALVTKTHLDKIEKDVKELSKAPVKQKSFLKKQEENLLISYLKQLEQSCFVCDRMEKSFERYLVTIYYLWKTDKEFQKRFYTSKGFCNEHYSILLEKAPKYLSGKTLEKFIEALHKVYIENLERVRADLEWFMNKFDYRYKDQPWKNSKDALQRTLTKLNGIIIEDNTENKEKY